MLALSVLTIPGAILQLIGGLTVGETVALDLLDWCVVSVFLLEYVLKLYCAADRTNYAGRGWNLLNLGVILLAFAGALTSTPLLYSAPLLRLFRATKLFAESGRSSVELVES